MVVGKTMKTQDIKARERITSNELTWKRLKEAKIEMDKFFVESSLCHKKEKNSWLNNLKKCKKR